MFKYKSIICFFLVFTLFNMFFLDLVFSSAIAISLSPYALQFLACSLLSVGLVFATISSYEVLNEYVFEKFPDKSKEMEKIVKHKVNTGEVLDLKGVDSFVLESLMEMYAKGEKFKFTTSSGFTTVPLDFDILNQITYSKKTGKSTYYYDLPLNSDNCVINVGDNVLYLEKDGDLWRIFNYDLESYEVEKDFGYEQGIGYVDTDSLILEKDSHYYKILNGFGHDTDCGVSPFIFDIENIDDDFLNTDILIVRSGICYDEEYDDVFPLNYSDERRMCLNLVRDCEIEADYNDSFEEPYERKFILENVRDVSLSYYDTLARNKELNLETMTVRDGDWYLDVSNVDYATALELENDREKVFSLNPSLLGTYEIPKSLEVDDSKPSELDFDLLGILQAILDAILSIPQYILDIYNLLVSFIAQILEFIKNLFSIPKDLKLNFSAFKTISLKNKFPFSIPFDVFNSIKVFSATAKKPILNIKIDNSFFNIDYNIDISYLNHLVLFFRLVCNSVFIYFLTSKTRDFIKW